MQDIYKNFHTEVIDGFEVRLRFEDEHISPQDMYIEDALDLENIYNGNVTWLCAIVEVYKCGIELSYTTLGAITYEWNKLQDFINDDYYKQMVDDAILEAKAKIQELRAA